jgi:SAM-dependent methyltransferase
LQAQNFECMEVSRSDAAWEAMYAPYDQPTYQAVLDQLRPSDVILDIGAGDLRLARKMARTARAVYALEINRQVLLQADPLPDNVIPIQADARAFEFPTDVTVGVLLMRHCTHFRLYLEKLRMAGARRLITNARWHMSVETIELETEPVPFNNISMGWYACRCGGVGFKIGPVEQWASEMDRITQEVIDCPGCRQV